LPRLRNLVDADVDGRLGLARRFLPPFTLPPAMRIAKNDSLPHPLAEPLAGDALNRSVATDAATKVRVAPKVHRI
jgi:hypothetical protein